MNFSSIKEYFYKVYSYCFLLMLIPMTLLVLIHYRFIMSSSISPMINLNEDATLTVLFTLMAVILTIVHLYSRKRLTTISKKFGLGQKLDDYFILTLIRVGAGVILCFVMIGGYIITQFDSLNVLFFSSLGWSFFQLPTSRKACKEMKLKGDEKEMVFYKKDRF